MIPNTRKLCRSCLKSCRLKRILDRDKKHLPLSSQIRSLHRSCNSKCSVRVLNMEATILKSPNDTRAYKMIKLENGLTALLISDKSTTDSQASFDSSQSPNLNSASAISDSKASSQSSKMRTSIASCIANYIATVNGKDQRNIETKSSPSKDGNSKIMHDNKSNPDHDSGTSSEDAFSDGCDTKEVGTDEDCVEEGQVRKKKKKKVKEQKEKMAAAALCVGVGSFHDPEDLQGLAHFLEHMLFMGSKKYPKENYFDSFIVKHGGSDNAFTDCEKTVYKLEIHQKYFRMALDIFANFFIEPLMKKESMERELEAVDSEFQLNLPSDSCRRQQLFGSFARERHPMRKFMWGNTLSLKEIPEKSNIDVHAKLRHFFASYYSPEIMTLAVQSKHSIAELESFVQEIFSCIPKRSVKPFSEMLKDSPFDDKCFSKLYKVVPIKKTHKVSITWALPSQMQYYHVKPLDYISWLVGHEGSGSILAYLRNKGWSLSLYAGNEGDGFQHNSTCSIFTILVSLTEEGMNHVKDVITCVFQYVLMLRNKGVSERIYDEVKTIEDNNFRWCEEENPLDYVESMCEAMQKYPPKHYLVGDHLFFEFIPKVIQSCLNEMVPEKANIMISSNRYQNAGICTKKEKWMQTSYCAEDIPNDWKKTWKDLSLNPEFELPPPNKYVSTDFDLKPNDKQPMSSMPVKLLEDSQSRLWFKKDNKFKVPKCCLYFHLISPICYSSPQNAVLFDLFINSLHQNLSKETYAAEGASLSFSFGACETGMTIQLDGFNQKLPILFEVILDHMAQFDVSDHLFENLKKHLHKSYYNDFVKSVNLAKDLRLTILQHSYWSAIDKRAVVKDVTKDLLLNFVREFLTTLFVEGLVHGNITAAEALQMNNNMKEKLSYKALLPSSIPEQRVMELPPGDNYCRIASFNNDDSNSVVTNYYQCGPGDIRRHVQMELLIMFMGEPCFDILRTQEQLGYDVGSVYRNTHGIVGFTITVRSSGKKYDCTFVNDKIEHFLEVFFTKMENLSDEEFKTQVSSLIKLKNCSDLSLQEETDRYWSEITSFNYVFDRLQKEISILSSLKLGDFRNFYRSHLPVSKTPEKVSWRKLGIQVVGTGDVALQECKICNLTAEETNLASGSNEFQVIRRCSDASHHVHPWKPRKVSSNTEIEGNSKSENTVYRFRYLASSNKSQKEVFIRDVATFKQTLNIFPVTKVKT